MAQLQQWFNFKFFESKSVKGELAEAEITAASFGRSYLILCDAEGTVRAFERGLRSQMMEFKAYNGCITHVKHLLTRNVVVTIGDDDSANVGIVRVWDLDRVDSTDRPQFREHRLFSPKFPPPPEVAPLRLNFNDDLQSKLRFLGRDRSAGRARVPVSEFGSSITCFDVAEDLQHIAAVLTTNEIIVVRGDLERGTGIKVRRLQPTFSKAALTFVGFFRQKPSETSSATAAFSHLLFCVFEDMVTAWRCTHKGEYQEFVCESTIGAARHCSAVNEHGLLAVADTQTCRVAFFGGDAAADVRTRWDPTLLKAHQWAEVEGTKRLLQFHRQYLVILTQADVARKDKFQLHAYDVESRVRGLSENLVNVGWVLPDVGQLVVITQAKQEDKNAEVTISQRVTKFVEMDLTSRLRQLFERECFDIAVSMTRRLGADSGGKQVDVQRRYGDHLFKKGKYEEAIHQYIETIGGGVEPSYVIRQFLDAQRIRYLTKYLEELHHTRHRIANRNHTTLLLDCYSKMHDREKLKSFIMRSDIRFDAHNAIKVCRQAGYFDEAVTLAEKYSLPADYVKIQLDNLRDAAKALAFIRRLTVDVAEATLLEHGKDLVALEPDATTVVLIELCTVWKGPQRRLLEGSNRRAAAQNAAAAKRPSTRAYAHEYLHVFVDVPVNMLQFLEGVAKSPALDEDFSSGNEELIASQKTLYNTLIELYLTKELKRSIKPSQSVVGSPGSNNARRSVDPNNGVGGSTTSGAAASSTQRLDLALDVMRRYTSRFDHYHVLALVQQQDFEEGILFTLRELKLFEEIFVHYAKVFERKDLPEAHRMTAKSQLISTCKNRPGTGEAERSLWISLLSILVRSDLDVAADIAQVLKHIQSTDLLPPVAVVEILGTNPKLRLRTVRDYVLGMLASDAESIRHSQEKLTASLERTATVNTEIRQLQTTAVVFQSSKCARCAAALDLPAVHFLCRHSYHRRCLSDAMECNICSAEIRRAAQEHRDIEARAEKHDDVFRRIAEAEDGFSAMADLLSTGVFSAPALRKEAVLVGTTRDAFDAEAEVEDAADDEWLTNAEELDNPADVEAW